MGKEIHSHHYSDADFRDYHARLTQETDVLRAWFAREQFAQRGGIGGLEVEAWLVDGQCRPVPVNQEVLRHLDDPLAVPELARFNLEFNTPPQPLHGAALSSMQADLVQRWQRAERSAAALGAGLLLAGILPTVRDTDLTLAQMSPWERYRALNEQVLRMRGEHPITLDIRGRDHLRALHHDVMLEAAATSLQLHLQLPAAACARYYNSAVILSAPMVAVAANSPYLFGYDLWDETRVPLFEQAVAVTPGPGADNRVTLGNGYVRTSLLECFDENLARYPVLLPTLLDEPPTALAHLRLHNGTVWRWNRPIIGFGDDGTPHLRLEHRVLPAGPSHVDALANAALFYGLLHACATATVPPETLLPFAQAQHNFYHAARHGLRSHIRWLKGKDMRMTTLLTHLLPLARTGLERFDMAHSDIAQYLGIIENRLRTGQNGAVWQRAFVRTHGADMQTLACAYREHQASRLPVHEWTI
jgi:hypothetical protein